MRGLYPLCQGHGYRRSCRSKSDKSKEKLRLRTADASDRTVPAPRRADMPCGPSMRRLSVTDA